MLSLSSSYYDISTACSKMLPRQRLYTNSANWKQRNIVIIIVGEHHADPASNGLIRQQMKYNHNLGVNQILCKELPCDFKNLEMAKSIDTWINQNNKFWFFSGIGGWI